LSFFESILLLVAVAVLLLQVSRRLSIPYPTMLAAAGVALALIPGTPSIELEPHTALALFIAPALVDAAFDFPIAAIKKLWRPLFALAIIAVLLSAGVVAWLGVVMAGLPIFAALALGAIVAPPDAAAATAILDTVSMPRRSVSVLEGESLLNDASALMLFTAAVTFQNHGGIDDRSTLILLVAVPGGLLLGIVFAKLIRYVRPYVAGTLGGNLLEFVVSIGVWVIAERMGLSAILCVVAFAMTIARSSALETPARSRIQSFAVWETAVFLLNIIAFLLMGMQAKIIIGNMNSAGLRDAGLFAAVVVVALILVRMVWVLTYNRLAANLRPFRGDYPPATIRQGVLVGWCGMRGIVTLATAFALPLSFPQRDLIVLTAFSVVLASLIIQGLTLAPLVRLLKLDGKDGLDEEIAEARQAMARAALATLEGEKSRDAEHWRYRLNADLAAAKAAGPSALDDLNAMGLKTVEIQRQRLEDLRAEQRVGGDSFLILQEQLDFAEVALISEDERKIVRS
jgi:monovalent cation/hydrogen antiporter